MPYLNQYNANIARQIRMGDEKWSDMHSFSPMQGNFYRQMGSGVPIAAQFKLGNANKQVGDDGVYNDDLHLGEAYYYGGPPYGMNAPPMLGSSGFAKGTFRDTGYGEQEGAGMSGGFAFSDLGDRDWWNNPSRMGKGASGGFSLGDLGNTDFYKDITVGKKGNQDVSPADVGNTDFWKDIQIGKKGSAKKFLKKAEKMGGSFWDDLKKFFQPATDVVKKVADVVEKVPVIGHYGKTAKDVMKLAGVGKRKKKGGAILGNPDVYESPKPLENKDSASTGVQPEAQGIVEVPKVEPAPAPAPAPEAQEKVGGSRTERAAIVKRIMKEKNLSMVQASKYVKEHGLYKGKGKEVKEVKEKVKGKKKGGAIQLPNNDVVVPKAQMQGAYNSGMTGSGKKARAALVKKIMAEKGLKMVEASKYIKEHGLKW